MLPPQNKFRHFNPRPPWGGRPVRFTNFARIANISIHALRGEGDHTQDFLLSCPQALFQSTPSVGRATFTQTASPAHQKISIHALRGEGDIASIATRGSTDRFQSTPSVGRATQGEPRLCRSARHFNPRPPWGGRRGAPLSPVAFVYISIHALRGEGDQFTTVFSSTLLGFQSTPSVGRATSDIAGLPVNLCYFNPRPPWGGRLSENV